MSFVKKGTSALGKLFIVIILVAAFSAGMTGVVYMSLQGEEMKVPEIVGKDFAESEKELAAVGLKIKRRADRYSTEKPNTILEQLPKPGDTVKTGQMILVVTSKTNPEAGEAPATIKKNNAEEDDSNKIEDLISDKPKKVNSNQNGNSNKKKTSTTRDVIKDKSNSNSNSETNGNSNGGNSNASVNSAVDKSNKNASTNSNSKPVNTSNSNKPNSNSNKISPSKPPTSGDVRPRQTPKP